MSNAVRRATETLSRKHGPAAGSDRQPDPPPDPMSLLDVQHLFRAYGKRVAVRDVSFRLGPGVTGLLGPNGAGKSSLINCLVGLAACDAGDIVVRHDGPEAGVGSGVGFMPERVSFPTEMRVRDYLRYAAAAKKVARAERRAMVELALRRTGLVDVAERIVGNLSKGYRQRLGLAQALLGDPGVVVLDEPMSGLDPLNIQDIRQSLAEYARERCVLLSTHLLSDAQILCDRVIVMSLGEVVYDGAPEAMATKRGGRRVKFRLRGDTDPSLSVNGLGSLRESGRIPDGWSIVVDVDDEDAVGELVRTLSRQWSVVTVEPTTDSLEDAFRTAVLGTADNTGDTGSGYQEVHDGDAAQA